MKDNKNLFAKLIDMTGSIDGDIVFMPMISKCKGLMVGEQVQYTPEEMERLMRIAEQQGIKVRFKPIEASDGRTVVVKDEVRIGIRMGMDFDEYVYTLAHELAHWFLHYDKGDTITSENHREYEEQADRAAKLLLLALSV